MSVNKVILIGRLGQDPEVRYSNNGAAICTISLATSERWVDKNTGQKQEKTEWHRVVFFGKLAEIAGQYLKKGSSIYIEGKLSTRKWQDKEGKDNYTTEVVVSVGGEMQMLDSKPQGQGQGQGQQHQQGQQYQQGQQGQQQSRLNQGQQQSYPQHQPQQQQGGEEWNDDIPFN